jgi:cytoskeleton protein RodZ
MPEIGATLREARMRERIDVSEIEAKTKIRAKYLRALENEEWDLLPGPTFVKSFLRTYAQALGLDEKALLEEYKLHYEHPGELPELVQQPSTSAARRARTRARGGAAQQRRTPPAGGPSRGYIAAVAAAGLVIVLLTYGLLSGGGSPKSSTQNSSTGRGAGHARAHRRPARRTEAAARQQLASLRLEPSAAVYVCLLGDGRKRIAGAILQAGEHEPIYHARRFELTLGNNAVTLQVNGAPRAVPASSSAIGYAITATGMRSLAPGELPTCR